MNNIYRLLNESCKPRNRFYTYDFLFNNCTTKVRDILDQGLKGNITYDSSFVDPNYSYRDYINDHLPKGALETIGINIVFGEETNEAPSFQNYSFLPDNFSKALSFAKIGENRLVKQTKILIEQPDHLKRNNNYIFLFMAILVVLVSSILEYRKILNIIWLDLLFFFLCGLSGLVLLFLWFFTSHHPTYNNFDLLWLNPLHFVYMLALYKKNNSQFVYYYSLVNSIILFILLLSYLFFLNQDFGVLVLMVIVQVRFIGHNILNFKSWRTSLQ